MSDRSNLYAEAFLTLIRAEGGANEVTDELFRFSRVLEGNEELRQALTDPHLPVERRQQIVEDLLAGKASPLTSSLVSTVVANGRVRSAVELSDDQKSRLAAALAASTGKQVEVVVEVDPSVLGGIVTQIGDTVIDGSVRQRLSQLRESF
jgi:F-type H+-transporting ATPase subunit delta